jgi:cyclophilin family peptidyl-prolyl cis-trans isomerase
MSVLLETTFGDVVIDLDTSRSPILTKNFLKLCKSRYFTQTLIYNVQPFRFCQLGDPKGDGTGGCSIFGLIDAVVAAIGTGTSSSNTISFIKHLERSSQRFIQQDSNSHTMELTKSERRMKGIVAVIPEMGG